MTPPKTKPFNRRIDDMAHADILDKIKVLDDKINIGVPLDEANREKITAMYKILVTGNGNPPLPETVRIHDAWIEDQKNEAKERKKQSNQIFLMGVGQILSLIFLAISIWIGLR